MVHGLCALLDEEYYLISNTTAMDDTELIDMSLAHEAPVIWVKCEDKYSVIIEQSIVLHFESFGSSFFGYIASFSVFNLSWQNLIKVKDTIYIIGCLQVKYFSLPIGDMNSPGHNKFTEGIDFFRQTTQTLGRVLEY